MPLIDQTNRPRRVQVCKDCYDPDAETFTTFFKGVYDCELCGRPKSSEHSQSRIVPPKVTET